MGESEPPASVRTVHDDAWLSDARTSYDRVALSYTEFTRGAFDRLPYVRAVFDLFAHLVDDSGGGPVVDAGCGPGWLTGHLARHGLRIAGIDLSPALVGIARGNNPGIPCAIGSITDLPLQDASMNGLVCWYVLHHVPDDALPTVLAQFRRVLRPGGLLLMGGHAGQGSRLKTEGYGGHPMRVQINLRTATILSTWLRDYGFAIDAQLTLDPDEASHHGIVFARRLS